MDSQLSALGDPVAKRLGGFPDPVVLDAADGFHGRTGQFGREHLHLVLTAVQFIRIILAVIATLVALVLVLPLLLVVLPFWLVSVFTRLIARAVEPKFLTREQLIQFDPVFGWRARPNLDTHHLMVDLFHIRTDSDGWRGEHSLAESNLVVFGDSFAADRK